jgi:N-[(2S)-2-amino-2-carboxyethyl]-L-glutamate dehydrogenase
MRSEGLLILNGAEVLSLLTGRERDILAAVQKAYEAHARGKSSLPHSTFLRFPGNPRDRIIALPAYLGDGVEAAGVKWIASFPANLEAGLDRASAVIILNSLETGRPEAMMEGAIISAKRTAASAALAASQLHKGETTSVGMIGCGFINSEIVRFLSVIYDEIKKLTLFDLDEARAQQFKKQCRNLLGAVEIEVASDLEIVLRNCSLISIATTATKPYITALSSCRPGSTILHISLRDLSPEVILSADNVVDDIDHVCRAETSVHLAERKAGNRDFIRATLADVLLGTAGAKKDSGAVTVFSPFGLGILDISLGKLASKLGIEGNKGIIIRSFFPDSWNTQT